MRLFTVVLLVGLLVSPVLAMNPVLECDGKGGGCGGSGGFKEGPAPGPDTGQVRVDPKVCPDDPHTLSNVSREDDQDFAWFIVTSGDMRYSLDAYETRSMCEQPLVRLKATLGSAGSLLTCKWMRR